MRAAAYSTRTRGFARRDAAASPLPRMVRSAPPPHNRRPARSAAGSATSSPATRRRRAGSGSFRVLGRHAVTRRLRQGDHHVHHAPLRIGDPHPPTARHPGAPRSCSHGAGRPIAAGPAIGERDAAQASATVPAGAHRRPGRSGRPAPCGNRPAGPGHRHRRTRKACRVQAAAPSNPARSATKRMSCPRRRSAARAPVPDRARTPCPGRFRSAGAGIRNRACVRLRAAIASPRCAVAPDRAHRREPERPGRRRAHRRQQDFGGGGWPPWWRHGTSGRSRQGCSLGWMEAGCGVMAAPALPLPQQRQPPTRTPVSRSAGLPFRPIRPATAGAAGAPRSGSMRGGPRLGAGSFKARHPATASDNGPAQFAFAGARLRQFAELGEQRLRMQRRAPPHRPPAAPACRGAGRGAEQQGQANARSRATTMISIR